MNSSASPLAWTHLLGAGWWVFLGVAGVALALLTLWAYRGNQQASRKRLAILIALRLLALVLAILTAGRPSVTVEDKPNVPSHLLVAIDMSRSMTVPDEAGGQTRLAAVRARLAACQPMLDELRDKQNCEVHVYAFGPSTFTPASVYKTDSTADGERSDYAALLKRLRDEWAGEKYLRGLLVIGDGADNGPGTVDGQRLSPADAAAVWRGKCPIHTFAVGDPATSQQSKDVGFVDVVLDPDPVAIKNKFVVRARVNAFKTAGLRVPVVVWFDVGDGKGYQMKVTEDRKLEKEQNNLLEIPVEAPTELPTGADGQPKRQIKVKVEIPHKDCPGDTNPTNNAVETFLNLNKEGLRVLVVDRYRYEYTFLLDALASDPRIDVRKVDLQTDEGGEDLKPAFDFDAMAYDVVIFGNVTPKQIEAVDPTIPARLAKRVQEKGMGFLMLGGQFTLNGNGADAKGWQGSEALREILPVKLGPPPSVEGERAKYVVVPEPRQAEQYLTKLADTRAASLDQWDRLNTADPSARMTALNRIKPDDVKPTATVYLWATLREGPQTVDITVPKLPADDNRFPLLVGQQLDAGTNSRVLVFAGQDSLMWQALGQPRTNDGIQLHSRFWRQAVLWLAKQDTEDARAFARPEFPRLKAGDPQGIRVGFRGPNGAAVANPTYELRVRAPGDPADGGAVVAVGTTADGTPRAEYVPRTPGEYTVSLKAAGKVNDADVTGDATAKFLVTENVSEEMQRTTPDHELLKAISAAGGGKFNRLEDLPAFLTELKNAPFATVAPTKKPIPDWRRDKSGLFLPGLMLIFALVLVAEWGLRRWWGMV